MTRTILGTLVAVVAGAAMVAAQGQEPASSRPSSSQSSQQSAASEQGKTYTGCLEEGTTPGTYVLNNASESGKGAAAASEAAGQPGQSQAGQASKAAGERFTLSGTAAGFDFKANLNHRVEITGTLASSSPSSQAGARPGAQPGGAMSSSSTMQSISVASAKSLSDRCSVQ